MFVNPECLPYNWIDRYINSHTYTLFSFYNDIKWNFLKDPVFHFCVCSATPFLLNYFTFYPVSSLLIVSYCIALASLLLKMLVGWVYRWRNHANYTEVGVGVKVMTPISLLLLSYSWSEGMYDIFKNTTDRR